MRDSLLRRFVTRPNQALRRIAASRSQVTSGGHRLERARNKVLGRAGIQVQAKVRGVFARRAIIAAKTHDLKAKEIRAAIEAKDTDEASKLMRALKANWAGAALAPGCQGVLSRFFADLKQLEDEVPSWKLPNPILLLLVLLRAPR